MSLTFHGLKSENAIRICKVVSPSNLRHLYEISVCIALPNAINFAVSSHSQYLVQAPQTSPQTFGISLVYTIFSNRRILTSTHRVFGITLLSRDFPLPTMQRARAKKWHVNPAELRSLGTSSSMILPSSTMLTSTQFPLRCAASDPSGSSFTQHPSQSLTEHGLFRLSPPLPC